MTNIEWAKHCESMQWKATKVKDIDLVRFWYNAKIGYMKRYQKELHK